MPRGSGLPGAIVARSLADWPVVLAAWLLLLSATTLIASGVVYGDAVALGGLRRAVETAPVVDRTVALSLRATGDELADLDATIRPSLEAALVGSAGEVARIALSGTLAAADVDRGAVTDLTRFAALEGVERHAALVAGDWPAPGGSPIGAALSEGAAAALGVGVGDRLDLVRRIDGRPVAVTISGIWRPDPADPYWQADPLLLEGVAESGRFTTRGPLVVAEPDLLAAAGTDRLDVTWRAVVAPDRLRPDSLDELRAGLGGLTARLRAALPSSLATRLETRLPDLLDEVSRSVLVARSGIVLLTVQFGVLAGYAVVLVAGMLVERRRAEIALVRARGASSLHLLAMAVGEALLLVVPSVLVAPVLAAAVVGLLGRFGVAAALGVAEVPPFSGGAIAVSAMTGVAAIAALIAPTLIATASPAGARAERGRTVRTSLPQRLGLDLALVVLAGLALWQLRLYGAPLTVNARGVLGLDPLLVAAPGIGLLGGAVLALRIVPRIAELAERLLSRGPGLVAALGGRQLARRPLRYTRAALLLMLAAALGTLASAHAATWTRSQADQAAYAAAADVRVVGGSAIPSWAAGSTYRAIAGVEAAMPVRRAPLDIGRAVRDGTLLAVDAGRAAAIVTPPAGDAVDGGPAPAAVLQLLDERALPTAAAPLPGEPRWFAATLDAAFRTDPAFGGGILDPDATGLTVALVLIDANGQVLRTGAGTARLVGDGQRLVFPLVSPVVATGADDAGTPAWPVRVLGVEITVRAPESLGILGSAELVRLEASADAAGATGWAPIDLDPGADGWRWLAIDGAGQVGYTPPPDRPGLVSVGSGAAIFGFPGSPGRTFRLAAAPSAGSPIPALASRPFLEASGGVVGDELVVTSLGQAIRVAIVAEAGPFPPLDPASPYLVVDGSTLAIAQFASVGRVAPADEWWLAVADGREAEVLAAARAAPTQPDDVVGREALATALATDPVPLGLIGVLGLGSLAAMVFAGIGFLVSATVSTSERLGELALLRALGLSSRQLSLWLALESVFLLGVGLVAGSALGLLLAWLVLPFATLTQAGTAPVPPAVVIVPWQALAPVWGTAVVLLVVSIVLVRRQLPDVRVSGVLRARDD